MKRMFAWKGHLVVATSISVAWELLQDALLDKPDVDGGLGGTYTMENWVAENCYDLSELYEAVDAREYLHAVDHGQSIEFSWADIPNGIVGELWGKTFQEPNMTDGPIVGLGSINYGLYGDASDWAEVLPVGFIYRPETA